METFLSLCYTSVDTICLILFLDVFARRRLDNLKFQFNAYTPSIDLFVEIAAFFDVTLDHLIMGKSLSDQEESLRNKLQQKRLANQKLRLKLQRIVQNLSAIAEEL